jgi:multisubunit Na+/H+ antiporter MnhB subunit
VNRIIPLTVLIILALFIFNSFEFDYGAPKPGVSEHYIAQGVTETGALNMVTAIYLNYRVYDTLGEATVFFAAALGVFMLLRKEREK